MVKSEESLLQHDGFSLELNRLQVVSKLVLNARDSGDAIGNILTHIAADLEQHVDRLGVELEGTVQIVLPVGLVSLGDPRAHVHILRLNLLYVCEEFADVSGLEGQVFVVGEDVLLTQSLLNHRLLLLLVHLVLGDFLLQLLVQVRDNRLDLVSKEKLLLFITRKLDADNLAEVTSNRGLAET